MFLNKTYKEFLSWVWLKERFVVDRNKIGIVDQQIRDYDDTVVKTKGRIFCGRIFNLGITEYLNAFLKQTKYLNDGGVALGDLEEQKSEWYPGDGEGEGQWLDIGGYGFPYESPKDKLAMQADLEFGREHDHVMQNSSG